MRKVTIWLVVSLGSTAMAAGTHAVQCQVKGQGPTRDRAIQNGLGLAVSTVHGVAVSTGLATIDARAGSFDVMRDPATGSRSLDVDSLAVRTMGTLTLTEAQGMVKSFEIADERQVNAEVYEVTLDVWVFDYRSPEDTQKLRLAVMPAEMTAQVCRFGNSVVPAVQVGEEFTQSLVGALAVSEKYTILDRDSTDAIRRERQLLARESTRPEELARLGQSLGADYLLVTTVSQAELLVKTQTNPAIGVPTREFDARVQAEYRVLVGPTRQVKMADEVRIRLEDNQIKVLAEKWESDEIDYAELRRNLIRLAAVRVAAGVAETLNPVKVALADADGQVILNQGGSRFAPGDQFEVYKAGQTIVDPETQQELGVQETLIARIEIVRVLPRIAYAKVLQGSLDASAVGSVCRLVRGADDTPAEGEGNRESQIEKTPSGGVRMPFDR